MDSSFVIRHSRQSESWHQLWCISLSLDRYTRITFNSITWFLSTILFIRGVQSSMKQWFILTSTRKDINTINGGPYSSRDDQNGIVVITKEAQEAWGPIPQKDKNTCENPSSAHTQACPRATRKAPPKAHCLMHSLTNPHRHYEAHLINGRLTSMRFLIASPLLVTNTSHIA